MIDPSIISSGKVSLKKAALNTVLTIAGSDPSGGAGIQADIKTFAAIGVYGAAVVSSLTVQNTKGVFRVQPLDPSLVKEQITCVLDDLEVSHIKIGMLGSAAIAAVICDTLVDFPGEIIYDPVLVSSSGRQLIDRTGYDTVRTKLLEICTVVTPNVPELKMLAEQECSTNEALNSAVAGVLRRYQKLRTVIVTGGHTETEKDIITDYLFTSSPGSRTPECLENSHARIASRNTHGTGCTFSAAFTAYHLQTGDDRKAFYLTSTFMDTVIRKSALLKIGHGTGPLVHHLR